MDFEFCENEMITCEMLQNEINKSGFQHLRLNIERKWSKVDVTPKATCKKGD